MNKIQLTCLGLVALFAWSVFWFRSSRPEPLMAGKQASQIAANQADPKAPVESQRASASTASPAAAEGSAGTIADAEAKPSEAVPADMPDAALKAELAAVDNLIDQSQFIERANAGTLSEFEREALRQLLQQRDQLQIAKAERLLASIDAEGL